MQYGEVANPPGFPYPTPSHYNPAPTHPVRFSSSSIHSSVGPRGCQVLFATSDATSDPGETAVSNGNARCSGIISGAGALRARGSRWTGSPRYSPRPCRPYRCRKWLVRASAGCSESLPGLDSRRRFRQWSGRCDGIVALHRRRFPGGCPWNRDRRLLAGNELVSNGFFRLEAAIRVPSQTTRKEVEERLVVAFEDLCQRLR